MNEFPQENVSEEELKKFDAMAAEWWDPLGKCRPLHELNPTRLQFIADRCRLNNNTVLDVGCGGGILSESMAKRGATVTGIDVSPAVLSVAKLHALKENLPLLRYEQTTAEDYAETHPAAFDVVTCLELLEHVPDPLSLIKACAKLVKPKGHLFFSTLNRTPKSYVFAVLGAEYALNLLPRGTHQYDKFIRPSELDAWLTEVGLQLTELNGLSYNPFTHRASLDPDISINYLAHAVSQA
jgi:2-polyprenyl-6-hydroxyphenyl methylase/3-demethylubiquinone-9 3-methyltransferase